MVSKFLSSMIAKGKSRKDMVEGIAHTILPRPLW
jgi:hypothetical protein